MAQEWAQNTVNRIKGRNKTRWDYIGNGRKRGHLYYYKPERLDSIPMTYQWTGLPQCNVTDGKPFTPPNGDYILAYTDGSKIDDGPSGFGTVVQYNLGGIFRTITHSGSLGCHATPYQGEVVAIMLAATEIIKSENKAQTLIFSDSQAALMALTKVSCNTLTVAACRKMLTQLGQLQNVGLNWVRAHVGHDLNEQADKLAKAGTTSQNIFEVPKSRKRSKYDTHIKYTEIWADIWARQKTCRQTRLMMPRPSKIVTDYIMSLDRTDCSLLVQFLTGHNYLKYHLYLTGVSSDKECRLCHDGTEDAWHLLTKCEPLFRLIEDSASP